MASICLEIKTLRVHHGVLLVGGGKETDLPMPKKLANGLGLDIKKLLD